ncbi:MAG: helix-turn-helix domain-containing protein [Candidatus Dormibacteria bacterium]
MGGVGASFGDEVRTLRAQRGLTQAELAERAGISERTVSDVERGLRDGVYPATARRLADALAVSDDARTAFLTSAAGDRSAPRGAAGRHAERAQARSRLPVPLTRLIGRELELAAVQAMLTTDAARLVSVVGPGGVGKTRLAIEAARDIGRDLDAAVHFVDLSVIDEPASLLAAIAAALSFAHVSDDVLGDVAAGFGDRPALLLLDTMEHVVDAAPALAELVGLCPQLRVLVTTRTALRIRGERIYTLHPLDVDDPASDSTSRAAAVELFCERARGGVAELPDDAVSTALARSVCARLDGLPLAIELAAAKLRHMSLPVLVGAVEHQLATLVDGHRDAPSRHRTMRATVEWSYLLLGDTERRVLRVLAVFRDGADIGAISAVTRSGITHQQLVAALDSLVDNSLVVRSDTDPARYRLLDVVAAYAFEHVETLGKSDGLHHAHATHFLAEATKAEPHLRGDEQLEWLRRLRVDEANFRAAMVWSLERQESGLALRLAASLWMFWRRAGLFTEAREWLDAALASDTENPPERLRVVWGAGWLAFHHGDYTRTATMGEQILSLTAGTHDALHRRNGLTLIGNAALGMNRDTDAVAALREALDICDGEADPWIRATSLLNVATALSASGHPDEAVEPCSEAARIYESVGDRHFAARAHIQLAYAHLRRQDEPNAERCLAEALPLVDELSDLWSTAEALEAVASIRAAVRPREAALLFGAASRMREQIGMRAHPPDERLNTERREMARKLLGDELFARAMEDGRHEPFDAMLDLAHDVAGGTA